MSDSAVKPETAKLFERSRQRRSSKPEALQRLRKVLLGALPFFIGAILWWLTTAFGLINETFLPTMPSVARALFRVFSAESYLTDAWVSIYRVMAAFAVSALLAVPIGLLSGYIPSVARVVEPFVGFVRYLPVPAFVPLCILWFGLGDLAKIVVIFLGTFFQLLLMASDVARGVPKDYFEAALTLGAKPRHLLLRVLWPASLPGVVSACRTAIGWAWTYLVVAEIAGATSGIGFRIMQAQRYVETPKVFAGIVVIGLLGMTTDLAFQSIQRVSFRWQ
jgi:NitT/TauT family transport system permease protein